MTTRRSFLINAASAASTLSFPSILTAQASTSTNSPGGLPMNQPSVGKHWRPPHRLGLGGVPLGNGFNKIVEEATAVEVMNTAWDAGIRLYDTSPFYGLGRSERRFGQVLSTKPREEFVLSTKVGRILHPDRTMKIQDSRIFKDAPPFRHVYDYSADGVRRSIEDSLQRLGLSYIDIVYVHDLGPSTPDFPNKDWRAQFEIARKGAFPALARMKQEGLIKAWGLGLNEPESVLAALEAADPDIILAASQYSLADHAKALDGIFPAVQKKGASIMVGTPLNTGFLSGKNRFNSLPQIPDTMQNKLVSMKQVAHNHQVDLRIAALQFANASSVVSGIIPGASHPEQVRQNAEAFRTKIPTEFWAEMKQKGLIDQRATVPA